MSQDTFDASHPTTGVPVRVLAVNDDDPAAVKWLVAYTDRTGRKRVESVDQVAPPKFLGKTKGWEMVIDVAEPVPIDIPARATSANAVSDSAKPFRGRHISWQEFYGVEA